MRIFIYYKKKSHILLFGADGGGERAVLEAALVVGVVQRSRWQIGQLRRTLSVRWQIVQALAVAPTENFFY
jgi:hypothetical protein